MRAGNVGALDRQAGPIRSQSGGGYPLSEWTAAAERERSSVTLAHFAPPTLHRPLCTAHFAPPTLHRPLCTIDALLNPSKKNASRVKVLALHLHVMLSLISGRENSSARGVVHEDTVFGSGCISARFSRVCTN